MTSLKINFLKQSVNIYLVLSLGGRDEQEGVKPVQAWQESSEPPKKCPLNRVIPYRYRVNDFYSP